MSEAMDMKAGEVGFHLLSREDAVKLGTRDLKKLMYDIKEEAKQLKLEVKVENWPGGLMFWWAPTEAFEVPENTFLDDLVEHMTVVPKGEPDVEREIIFTEGGPKNVEDLVEKLKAISETVKKNFIVKDVYGEETIHISWEPQWTDNSIAYLGDDGESRVINAKPDVAPVEWNLDENRAYTQEEIARIEKGPSDE